ncbi:hypothetical protein EDEG_02880 [Edhazardia aedis USNM 41457]|uniref:Uncharacterized protein n=1 Tax=Edhazardia aedis (strain USNM 41457) TaxID=1003232 RepID=J9DMZ5_EDHAE|nr:hypothetical protein EDEG_02880 [Edhazardia aedis USNM 41457]|eukprot:EJW02727.1 hypothetical protein EDEG_02880 [Edhazardia aedis USNM 41457]
MLSKDIRRTFIKLLKSLGTPIEDVNKLVKTMSEAQISDLLISLQSQSDKERNLIVLLSKLKYEPNLSSLIGLQSLLRNGPLSYYKVFVDNDGDDILVDGIRMCNIFDKDISNEKNINKNKPGCLKERRDGKDLSYDKVSKDDYNDKLCSDFSLVNSFSADNFNNIYCKYFINFDSDSVDKYGSSAVDKEFDCGDDLHYIGNYVKYSREYMVNEYLNAIMTVLQSYENFIEILDIEEITCNIEYVDVYPSKYYELLSYVSFRDISKLFFLFQSVNSHYCLIQTYFYKIFTINFCKKIVDRFLCTEYEYLVRYYNFLITGRRELLDFGGIGRKGSIISIKTMGKNHYKAIIQGDDRTINGRCYLIHELCGDIVSVKSRCIKCNEKCRFRCFKNDFSDTFLLDCVDCRLLFDFYKYREILCDYCTFKRNQADGIDTFCREFNISLSKNSENIQFSESNISNQSDSKLVDVMSNESIKMNVICTNRNSRVKESVITDRKESNLLYNKFDTENMRKHEHVERCEKIKNRFSHNLVYERCLCRSKENNFSQKGGIGRDGNSNSNINTINSLEDMESCQKGDFNDKKKQKKIFSRNTDKEKYENKLFENSSNLIKENTTGKSFLHKLRNKFTNRSKTKDTTLSSTNKLKSSCFKCVDKLDNYKKIMGNLTFQDNQENDDKDYFPRNISFKDREYHFSKEIYSSSSADLKNSEKRNSSSDISNIKNSDNSESISCISFDVDCSYVFENAEIEIKKNYNALCNCFSNSENSKENLSANILKNARCQNRNCHVKQLKRSTSEKNNFCRDGFIDGQECIKNNSKLSSAKQCADTSLYNFILSDASFCNDVSCTGESSFLCVKSSSKKEKKFARNIYNTPLTYQSSEIYKRNDSYKLADSKNSLFLRQKQDKFSKFDNNCETNNSPFREMGFFSTFKKSTKKEAPNGCSNFNEIFNKNYEICEKNGNFEYIRNTEKGGKADEQAEKQFPNSESDLNSGRQEKRAIICDIGRATGHFDARASGQRSESSAEGTFKDAPSLIKILRTDSNSLKTVIVEDGNVGKKPPNEAPNSEPIQNYIMKKELQNSKKENFDPPSNKESDLISSCNLKSQPMPRAHTKSDANSADSQNKNTQRSYSNNRNCNYDSPELTYCEETKVDSCDFAEKQLAIDKITFLLNYAAKNNMLRSIPCILEGILFSKPVFDEKNDLNQAYSILENENDHLKKELVRVQSAFNNVVTENDILRKTIDSFTSHPNSKTTNKNSTAPSSNKNTGSGTNSQGFCIQCNAKIEGKNSDFQIKHKSENVLNYGKNTDKDVLSSSLSKLSIKSNTNDGKMQEATTSTRNEASCAEKTKNSQNTIKDNAIGNTSNSNELKNTTGELKNITNELKNTTGELKNITNELKNTTGELKTSTTGELKTSTTGELKNTTNELKIQQMNLKIQQMN